MVQAKGMRGDKLVCACRWLACVHRSCLWCISCRLLAIVGGWQARIARAFGAFRAGFWLLSLIGMRASLVPLARFVQAFGCFRWQACAHRSWLWRVSCRLLATVAGRQACIARGFGAFRAGFWLLSLAGMREVMSYGVTKAWPMTRHAEKFERVAHHQCEKNEGTGQTSLCTSATNHASFIRFSRFSALTLHIIYNVNNKTCH